MKRVCIVRQKYWPNKNVVRNSEALVSQGYEVDVFCLRNKGEKARETIRGVNVHRLPLGFRRGNVLWYLFEYSAFFFLTSLILSWRSLRKRYQVIEVDTMPDFFVFITLIPRLLGTKVVLYMYENMPELFISTFKTGPNHIGARLLRFLERISAGYAHRVIVSDGIPYKRVLESRGIPGEKITVVLNVPDDAIFDPESVDATKNGEHFRLISVSTIVERYGVQTLIRAVPLLIEDIPELRVDVVGDGEYRSELEGLAHDLGVVEHIRFTGMVPLESIPPFIAEADVGVMPMLADLGLPNKLFEYFALGKPSVASALPSLKLAFDESYVLFYEPDDEKDMARRILELYYSPEKRASMSSRAQAFYRNCNWQVMKHEYLKVYEELLA
jgi:glycosyltransferase involved in cell wall biosynthesis